MQRKRRQVSGWIAAPLVALATGACVTRKPIEDCVSVGGGWRACSAEMSTPAEAGPDAIDSGTGAGARADGGIRSPTAPVQSGGQAVGAAGRTTGAGGAGTQAAANGGTSSASASNGGADAPGTGGDSTEAGSGGEAGASETAGRGGAAGGATAGASGWSGSSGQGGPSAPRAGESGAASAGASGTGASGSNGTLPSTCCHSLGLCVEVSSLTSGQRALLGRDSCEGDDVLCAPTPVIGDARFVPRSCRSVIQAEGRCLPECMSNLAAQPGRFPQDVCGTHEVCAPCFDPITGNATGSCNLGADPGPRELPQRFSGCCPETGASQGMCVPRSYLPPGVTMPQAECGPTMVCTPRTLVSDPTAEPTQCSADIRGPGICVPQCIGDAIALILTVQATCAASEVCYPCELVGGTPTGVCPAVGL